MGKSVAPIKRLHIMNNSPVPVTDLIPTLADLFRHQGRDDIVELLEAAHARFDETDYDNWNGGTSTWALRLEVPVGIFASVEFHLSQIESDVSAKLNHWDRQFSNDHFGEVTISPISAGSAPAGHRMAPSEVDVRRLWTDGRFRLFLSHVSKHRVAVSRLKDALWLCGIDAFVAHEDIEPSLEWQREIELALRSMHALASLITPDFHDSKWTDQEVGWALGRDITVVPVRLGADPYGLVGKFQGVTGTLPSPDELASRIAVILIANRQTAGEMRRALLNSFASASSPAMAVVLHRLVMRLVNASEEERQAIWKACENSHVNEAKGVVPAIYATFGKPPAPQLQNVESDIPF